MARMGVEEVFRRWPGGKMAMQKREAIAFGGFVLGVGLYENTSGQSTKVTHVNRLWVWKDGSVWSYELSWHDWKKPPRGAPWDAPRERNAFRPVQIVSLREAVLDISWKGFTVPVPQELEGKGTDFEDFAAWRLSRDDLPFGGDKRRLICKVAFEITGTDLTEELCG